MGAFGLGLLEGITNTTNAALQKHIEANKDRFDANMASALANNVENSKRYNKKARDANEALELISSLTGGNLDQAAVLIEGMGGVPQAAKFYDSFKTAQQTNENLTIDSVVKWIGDQRETDLTNQQAINQLVEPFAFTTPAPRVKRTGVAGWFDDPRRMATELPKTLRARGINPTKVGEIIKLQKAEIKWGMLRTPEQRVANKKANLGIAIQEANVLKGTAGVDYEGTLAKLDTQLMIQSQNLAVMKSRGVDRNDPKYRELLAKHDATLAHQSDMRLSASAYGTTAPNMHSKINPDSRHNSILRNNMTANGIKFELGIDNKVGKIISGEAPALYKSYRDTYQQLLADGEKFPAMQGNILNAYAQQITSENTTMTNVLNQYRNATTADKKKFAPKMLYVMVEDKNGKMQLKLDSEKMKIINPKIKEGDLVMINSNAHNNHRKENGFEDTQHTVAGGASYSLGVYIDNRSILGNRNLNAIPQYNKLRTQFGRGG